MIVQESIKRDLARLIVWYPIRWMIRILPISAGYQIIAAMGWMHYQLSSRFRALLMKNLQLGLNGQVPEDSPWDDWVKKYMQLHYVGQLSIFLFPSMTKKNVAQFHTFKGIEHLEQARKEGNGVILLHAHFGPAHLPLHHLGLIGYPILQIGLPTNEGLSWVGQYVAFRLRLYYESKIAATIVPVTAFLRPVLEGLKKDKKVVMTTGDGAGNGNYIGEFSPVPFLSQQILVATGPVDLARRTDAVILPLFTEQLSIGHYQSTIYPPINQDNLSSDQEIMQKWATIFEEYVKKQPYCWHFWDEYDQRLEDVEKA